MVNPLAKNGQHACEKWSARLRKMVSTLAKNGQHACEKWSARLRQTILRSKISKEKHLILLKINHHFLNCIMATFHQDEFYHIYNQGNNRQPIFNDDANCVYFISLIEKYVAPHCDIISWCLMPNHFHFLVKTNQHSVQEKLVGALKLTNLSNGLRILQTAYTAAFNRQFNMSGSLFRQRSKAKLIDTSNNDEYLMACFHYIHQNPLKAGLVYKMEDWKYSSFKDYLNQSIFTITQKDIGIQYLNLDESTFYKESYGFVNNHLINKIS